MKKKAAFKYIDIKKLSFDMFSLRLLDNLYGTLDLQIVNHHLMENLKDVTFYRELDSREIIEGCVMFGSLH